MCWNEGKVLEGPLEDEICVATDSYGNHYRPGVEGLLEHLEALNEAAFKRGERLRLRITIETVATEPRR